MDPENAGSFENFGYSCVLARRYGDADLAFRRALTLNPHWAEVYAMRAWLQLSWHGDVDKAHAVINEAKRVVGLVDGAGWLGLFGLEVALARRDYQGALLQLQAETRTAIDNQEFYSPIPLLLGQVYTLASQQDLARRSFETARLVLEQRVMQGPDDHRFHGSLGIAYAGLGRRAEAVREARRGCELMPASKDALVALSRSADLALVYTMVGQPAKAIAALDDLLARSGLWTPHRIRLEPWWDPLRLDPRFQALLTKYEVKE